MNWRDMFQNPTPFTVLHEITAGCLNPAQSQGFVRKMLDEFNPDDINPVIHSLDQVMNRLQPFYRKIRESGVDAGADMAFDVFHEADKDIKAGALADYHCAGFVSGENERLSLLIRTEWIRIVRSVESVCQHTKDDNQRLYTLSLMYRQCDELAALALISPGTGRDSDINRVLRAAALSLCLHIRLREPRAVPAGVNAGTLENDNSIFKTPAYWTKRIETQLEAWASGHKDYAPVPETVKLLEEVDLERTKPKSGELENVFWQTQVVLLLMIFNYKLKKPEKRALNDSRKADEELDKLDAFLRFGGHHEKETVRLFDYSDRLERNFKEYKLNRFPLIKDRYEILKTTLERSFRSLGGKPVKETGETEVNSSIPTAVERLRNEYFTIQQLADHFGVTDRAIRENIKKIGIKTIKRSKTTLVPYREFVKHQTDND